MIISIKKSWRGILLMAGIACWADAYDVVPPSDDFFLVRTIAATIGGIAGSTAFYIQVNPGFVRQQALLLSIYGAAIYVTSIADITYYRDNFPYSLLYPDNLTITERIAHLDPYRVVALCIVPCFFLVHRSFVPLIPGVLPAGGGIPVVGAFAAAAPVRPVPVLRG